MRKTLVVVRPSLNSDIVELASYNEQDLIRFS